MFCTDLPAVIRHWPGPPGSREAYTVPYGTDGLVFGEKLDLVVMGPGDIKQAHTVDEWMSLDQFDRAIDVYKEMIHRFCN